ncbi:MAG: septation ring formation regulator EzrA [Betaproteobacteria bacterium]|nr:septation ring formation regulator EzrA [Betaproteobacteria bacterium]
MGHRAVPAALISLLVILHAQLWFGRGSVPNVARLSEQLKVQQQKNQQAQLTNSRLAAEVRDLKEGLDMVEEKARLELGMVKANEIYVQIAR